MFGGEGGATYIFTFHFQAEHHPEAAPCEELLQDQAPDRKRANVVYQVPCANCPTTYVRQTGRQFNQRLREHRRTGDCANSALAEHARGCHHPVDWDHVRVLDCYPHLHQRLTLESVHIRSQSKPVNRDLGIMPQVYNPLFN